MHGVQQEGFVWLPQGKCCGRQMELDTINARCANLCYTSVIDNTTLLSMWVVIGTLNVGS